MKRGDYDMKALILILLLSVYSCGKKDDKKACNEQMEALDGRTTALIVGDSISIGYTPKIKSEFPSIQVIHNECNAQGTRKGKLNIERWAAHSSRWSFCTINHGMWDLEKNSPQTTEIEEYLRNLEFEVNTLKAVCDVIIFNTTTRIPVNANAFRRDELDTFNQEAVNLMNSLNISICDLKTVSETIVDKHIKASVQNDVHYTQEGYDVLGLALAECIADNI